MGGHAFSIGASFQARATAYVYVHVLAGSRLLWFEPVDDTPIAVEAETGGAGDDLRVQLRSGDASAEVQVKHGLGGGVAFSAAVRKAASRTATRMPVRILLDQCSPLHLRRPPC